MTPERGVWLCGPRASSSAQSEDAARDHLLLMVSGGSGWIPLWHAGQGQGTVGSKRRWYAHTQRPQTNPSASTARNNIKTVSLVVCRSLPIGPLKSLPRYGPEVGNHLNWCRKVCYYLCGEKDCAFFSLCGGKFEEHRCGTFSESVSDEAN